MSNLQSQSSTNDAPNTNFISQSGSAGSPAVSNQTSQSALPQPSSYASATKQASPASSTAVGQSQHGKRDSVNGRSTTMANPTIVNSSNATNGASPVSHDHGRKPSVTISASGASGYTTNGGPVAPNSRPNINFGSIGPGGTSPAIANSTPQIQSNNLPAPPTNPRITSPAASPSPIPAPSASGGRPPSFQSGQGNGLTFGSVAGSDSDPSRQSRGAPPPGPAMQGQHLRRESSQSGPGESGGYPMAQTPSRGGYGSGRGRGSFNAGYPPMAHSPGPGYRPMSNTPGRPPANFPPHMQGQMGGPYPGSPQPPPRSPAFSQPPQHGSPHMNARQMSNSQMSYPPSYAQYQQHLGPQPGQYGMQPHYDPNYGYYQAPYNMTPPYLHGPPSPTPYQQMPPTARQQQYAQGQYNQSGSQSMSRTSSHSATHSERPPSSVGAGQQHPPQSMTPQPGQSSHTPSQSVGSTTASSNPNFTIPSKVSKGVIIKNAAGEVVNFDKSDKKASPSPSLAATKSPSPAPPASDTSTPPPAIPAISHNRTESKSTKSSAEIKQEFLAQVKKQQEGGKDIKEEEEVSAPAKTDEPSTAVLDEAPEQKSDSSDDRENVVAEQAEDAKDTVAEATGAATAAESEKVEAQEAKAEVAAPSTESDEEEKKKREQEEEERMIAEMEAAEREEEEREKAYAKKAAEEAARKKKEAAERADEEMKRAEREADEAEQAREARIAQKGDEEETEEAKAERENLFASLKKPTLGPGAESQSGTETPVSDDSMPPPQKTTPAPKPKPGPLKLDTVKPVEPAAPTPGMQALKSARLLQLQSESVKYPEGIASPNPAVVSGTKRNGKAYDRAFLMQFQTAFKEKPIVDWDQRVKETVGDVPDSAGPKSARTPSGMGGRAQSNRGPPPSAFQGMGTFGQGQNRTLPPGTTSADRFQAANSQQRMGSAMGPFAQGRPGSFPMPAGMPVPMARQGSMQSMGGPSPRQGGSQRGKAGSQRNDRVPSKKEQDHMNKAMPLTAAGVKPLEASGAGWKPQSIGKPQATTDPSGHMPPDVVQRKVKSNLNKMTPERFDKIADQILAIAAQSKDEADGRTLRQVIALTFEKACDEAHWASMYAKFCKRMLEEMSGEIKDENVRDKTGAPVVGGPLFRKYLLNRCQEEFERGWTVNLPEKKEGDTEEAAMLSDEYYVAAAAKRKGLGLIQFIGELYKLGMLSIRIMHQCVMRLLDFEGMPDESAVESLVKLLRTVGAVMESTDNGPPLLKTYFERIEKTMNMQGLPSRLYYMLLDLIEIRKEGWATKDDSKGPKTIQEIREEAAHAQQQAEAERLRQNQRGGGGGRIPQGRGDARSFSGNPMGPPDYPRNQVATDDLRRLNQKAASRQASQGPNKGLGPTSMFASRSSSGRAPLGPGGSLIRGGDDSGGSSRNASHRERKDDDAPKGNAFSALAALETEGDTPQSSPMIQKAQLATSDAKSTTTTEQPKSDAEPSGADNQNA